MAISKEQMKDMYVKMRRIRDFESTAARLFAEGKIPGFVHLYLGEEAIAPAVCECLRDDDFITSTHRGHGHIIAKGGDLNLMMAELFGRETGYCKGKGGSMHIADRDKGILGANGIVGAGHCISTGAGLSAKIRGTDQVCVCFFGDGSTNQGTFHESLNMASIWKLPIIFVCENNHYGISMSQDRHQAIKDVADRGAAYNIPGIAVDGETEIASAVDHGEPRIVGAVDAVGGEGETGSRGHLPVDAVVAERETDIGFQIRSAGSELRFGTSVIVAEAHHISAVEFADSGIENKFRLIRNVVFT